MPDQTRDSKPTSIIVADPALAYDRESAPGVCGMGQREFDREVAEGRIAYVKVGKGTEKIHRVFLREDLLEWLRSRRVPARRQTTTPNNLRAVESE